MGGEDLLDSAPPARGHVSDEITSLRVACSSIVSRPRWLRQRRVDDAFPRKQGKEFSISAAHEAQGKARNVRCSTPRPPSHSPATSGEYQRLLPLLAGEGRDGGGADEVIRSC